jgi:hypothetical protein
MTLERNLDDIVSDIDIITKRIQSLSKRLVTMEIIINGAVHHVEQIEKEVIHGPDRRRRNRRRDRG